MTDEQIEDSSSHIVALLSTHFLQKNWLHIDEFKAIVSSILHNKKRTTEQVAPHFTQVVQEEAPYLPPHY